MRSAPLRFIGQKVDIDPSPKSESAHQPCVLQVHPPDGLHAAGKRDAGFPVGALAQHDRVAQTVGDAGNRDGSLGGLLLNQVGPPTSGNMPDSAVRIAELSGKYMNVPTMPR